jgi:lipopolysaccharide assembly protein A
MQFLKTVFWVLVAVLVVLFAKANWIAVPVTLWANLQADIKLPVLLLIAFLLGWLPTWLIHRARLWTLNRRLDAFERQRAAPVAADAPAVPAEDAEPVT